MSCKCCEKKIDRRCNVCGNFLTELSPNWFQCSEQCRAEKWEETAKSQQLIED